MIGLALGTLSVALLLVAVRRLESKRRADVRVGRGCLADWSFDRQEQRVFLRCFAKRRFGVFLTFARFLMSWLCGTLLLLWLGEVGVSIWPQGLGLVAFLGGSAASGLAVLAGWDTVALLRRARVQRVQIFREALVYDGHLLEGLETLRSVQATDDPPRLHIRHSWEVSSGESLSSTIEETITLPIPRGRADEARAVVAALKALE